MNPFAVIALLPGLLAIFVSGPFVRRRVKPNDCFGVRSAGAFESEEAWFAINEYGFGLFRLWGIAMIAMAIVGVLLRSEYWIAYNWIALVIDVGGLAVVLVKISRFARNRKGT